MTAPEVLRFLLGLEQGFSWKCATATVATVATVAPCRKKWRAAKGVGPAPQHGATNIRGSWNLVTNRVSGKEDRRV